MTNRHAAAECPCRGCDDDRIIEFVMCRSAGKGDGYADGCGEYTFFNSYVRNGAGRGGGAGGCLGSGAIEAMR